MELKEESRSKQQVESVAGRAGSSNPFNARNPSSIYRCKMTTEQADRQIKKREREKDRETVQYIVNVYLAIYTMSSHLMFDVDDGKLYCMTKANRITGKNEIGCESERYNKSAFLLIM